MGFYAPAQLVQDVKNHGVKVAEVDVNFSHWECTLEPIISPEQSAQAVQIRLGMLMIRGLPASVGSAVVEGRQRGPFRDMADLARRCGLTQAAITRLADAGALRSLAGDRRAAYWQALAQERSGSKHQLFDGSDSDQDEPIPAALQPMQPIEEVYADYQSIGLSLRGHPLSFARVQLNRLRVTTAKQLLTTGDGSFVRVAGLVLVRQRPGTAKGITFVTLEDEFGSMNIVVKPDIWQKHYKVARLSNAWLVHGVIESRESVIHIIAGRIDDLGEHVSGLEVRSRDFH
jgi:error-prone DNA polymerase